MTELSNKVVEEIDYALIHSFSKETLQKYELEVVEALKNSPKHILNPGLNLDEAEQISYYFTMKGFDVLADSATEGITYELIISKKN